MLQQEQPEDFVIATGQQYSVRDFVRRAAAVLGIELEFTGAGLEERAVVSAVHGSDAPAVKVGDVILVVDPGYFRPAEVDTLLGDASKARERLGWTPEISFDEMIEEMVGHDLDKARQHALLRSSGFEVAVSRER
jgi:GDPmannose 4,6-dehydratase